MRIVSWTWVFAAMACAGLSGTAQAKSSHPVVIELFSSQGCGDCPAADRILSELARRDDVIALTLPITYWDMLGWKDTLATEANTARQRAYAKSLRRNGVYTPQMIIDGASDIVGNRADRITAAVATRAAAHTRDSGADLSLSSSHGRIAIAIGPAPRPGAVNATVWLMSTSSHASVRVAQGENRNRELTYTNVVRGIAEVGHWTGTPITLSVPLPANGSDSATVVVQEPDHGAILAAASIITR